MCVMRMLICTLNGSECGAGGLHESAPGPVPLCESDDHGSNRADEREVCVGMCRVYDGGRQVRAGFREHARGGYGEGRGPC